MTQRASALNRAVCVAFLLLLAGCDDKRSDIEKAADSLGSAIFMAAIIRALFNK